MARVKKATMKDWNAVGIHLVAPTKTQIANAKEDADNKGFGIVWVHRKGSEKGITKRMNR